MSRRRRFTVFVSVLLVSGLAITGVGIYGRWYAGRTEPTSLSTSQETKTQEKEKPAEFIYLTKTVYDRGSVIGDVLLNRFGLNASQLATLPADMSREFFYEWLESADKSLETTSLLRVPQLRADRPILDGQDIYDGFFAPKPAFWDLGAPLEGSVSALKKQGFKFSDEDLSALEAMLRATMGYTNNDHFQWRPFPVGSRIVLQAGRTPSVTIWINEGKQLPTVKETLGAVQEKLVLEIAVTDPAQKKALNMHFNYALEAKDERVEQNTHGKYHTPRERLFEVVREYREGKIQPQNGR